VAGQVSEQTRIAWATSTFNPWVGCTKVGPGCDHCYAEALMDARFGRVKWGAGQPRQRTSAANWRQPIAWNEKAAIRDNGKPSSEAARAAEDGPLKEARAKLAAATTKDERRACLEVVHAHLAKAVYYRYAVGRVELGMFFLVEGQGDTWEDAFAKVDAYYRKKAA